MTVALRTQQIIAEETGVALTVDPLGGSYFLETLTDQMEARRDGVHPHDRRAWAASCGPSTRAIRRRRSRTPPTATSSWTTAARRSVVGVNKYVMTEEQPIDYLRIDDAVEHEQIERVGRFKASRDAAKVERRLKQLAEAVATGANVMPVLVDAVKDYVSLGEISDVYRRVFGLYREPIIF